MTTLTYPRISLVTPSYKAADLIEQTIQSVLQQKYPNLEYIILDGAGDTATADVIRKYESSLAYWHSEPDGGQYDAINKGFARATGEILGWLNADDMLLPRSLFLVAELFSTFKDVEWLTTLQRGLWDANGYFVGTLRKPGYSREAFLDGLNLHGLRPGSYWIQQESSFWRRGLWDKAGGRIPPSYPLAGDFALWAEFYKHATLYGVDYPIGGFRTILGQRSGDRVLYAKEAFEALTEMRRHFGWTNSPVNALRYDTQRIQRMLANGEREIGELLRQIGYESQRIHCRAINLVGPQWVLSGRLFLP